MSEFGLDKLQPSMPLGSATAWSRLLASEAVALKNPTELLLKSILLWRIIGSLSLSIAITCTGCFSARDSSESQKQAEQQTDQAPQRVEDSKLAADSEQPAVRNQVVSSDRESLQIEMHPDSAQLCPGECIDIAVDARGGNPPYSFSWDHELWATASRGPHEVCPEADTTYTVIVRDTGLDTEEFSIPAEQLQASIAITLSDQCVAANDGVWLTSSSDRVNAGDDVTLDWATPEASSCEITPGGVEVAPSSEGTTVITVDSTTTFTLACLGPEGSIRSDPVTVVVTGPQWTQVSSCVSAEGAHTCAVKADGRLFCWGWAAYGQLGNNSTSPSFIHVPAQEYTEASDWAQVSTSTRHTCAIKTDGRLFCWGWVGEDYPNNDFLPGSPVPEQESTEASDWDQVSAGGFHTCAIKTDGRLFCWGANGMGALGDNSTELSLVPVQEYTTATDWVQVSAGLSDDTCAIKKDGRLFCWGWGEYGQLGNDSTSGSYVPIQEYTMATDWAQVSAGYEYTCAVKTDGRLFCWGRGIFGQLGNDSTSDSEVPVQEYMEATDWAQVSAGLYRTCAVKTDGRLFSWGWKEYGQLGNHSTPESHVPIQEYTAATDWFQVSTGSGNTCAIKTDGSLYWWGKVEGSELHVDSSNPDENHWVRVLVR